jgi:hypothetical protein
MHLSQFYDVLVEVRAAVDVLFDTLAYMEAGDDEQRYQAFKEALYERHQHAKAEHLENISELLSRDMPGGDGAVGEGGEEPDDRTPPWAPADED